MTATTPLPHSSPSSRSSPTPGGSRSPGSRPTTAGLTREARTLDLRQFTAWCRTRTLSLFAVRRANIETFARPGGQGPGPGHRHPAAVHHRRFLQVRRRGRTSRALPGRARPPLETGLLDYESRATALDRNELGAILVAAGLGPPAGQALISLLALNGLRVCEATGADIEQLGGRFDVRHRGW